MSRWRIAVHALDRTGPPMLALALTRWIRRERPDIVPEIVAFRGGDLVDAFVEHAAVDIVLDPSEAWDPAAYVGARADRLRRRFAALPPVDATLLVSVSAAQALPLLPDDPGPVVTWSVERGEDLHWLDAPVGVIERTAVWAAGSSGTRDELRARLGAGAAISICPEFVDEPAPIDPAVRDRCRRALGAFSDEQLVVGAGIGTSRKGIDLFLEAAALAHRRGAGHVRFAWIGGEPDDLHWRVRGEAQRLGLDNIRWFSSVVEPERWLAAADVLLHAARLDAFPLICLHAALVGTPVVSFAGVGGVEEMFGPAFVGAPYPDVAGLLTIVEGLRESEAREQVGRAQRDAVSERFTTRAAAHTIVDLVAAAQADADATDSIAAEPSDRRTTDAASA